MSQTADPDRANLPRVSIVMPVLNEGEYLATSLDAIDAQTYPRDCIEIAIVDGGSTDDTLQIATARAHLDDRIRILGGPGVNTPAAMNVGIQATTGSYVAKVDGHGWVNPSFVSDAVAVLDSDARVGCVGGQIFPIARTPVEQANRIARFSQFGVGGGIYTASLEPQDIDTVQCGVYRRTTLREAGDFDPKLQFGEDEEANHRVRLTGSVIRFQPSMRFSYVVRPTFGSLFRQYRNYGRARVAVIRKHPTFFRLKHVAPAALLAALAASAVLLVVGQVALGIIVPILYALALVAVAIGLSVRHGFGKPWLVAVALLSLHIGYGVGTYLGIGDLVRRSR